MRKLKILALVCAAYVCSLGACVDRAQDWLGQEQPWIQCGPDGCVFDLDLDT